MNSGNEATTSHESQLCFNSLLEHWAEARIDGPMQAIARFDDVAKLFITVGGFLQAVLVAAYTSMFKSQDMAKLTMAQASAPVIIFILLVVFFICAGCVCVPQPMMRAEKIMLLKEGENLTGEVKEWCKDIDRILKLKKRLLLAATIFFCLSFLYLIGLLLIPLA